MAAIRCLSGPAAGTEHEFAEPIVIGRSDSDFDIADPEVSRRHLRLTPVDGGVEVEDLGSSNGTWLDDKRLDAVTVVHGTTAMRIGTTRVEIVAPEPIPVPDVTRISTTPDDGATVIADQPAAAASPPPPPPEPVRELEPEPMPAPAPPPPPPPQAEPMPAFAANAPVNVAAAQPFGAYASGPRPRRSRGPATRRIAPAALTIAVILATTIALIIYFAAR